MDNRKLMIGAGAVGIGIFAYKYYRTAKILQNAMYSYRDIYLIGWEDGKLVLGVAVDVRATGHITLSNIRLNLYVNGQKLGRLILPYAQDIVKGERTIIFKLYVSPSEVANDVISVLTSSEVRLSIEGSMMFNFLPIAFPNIVVITDKLQNIFDEYFVSKYNSLITGINTVNIGLQDKTENKNVFLKRGYSKDIIDAICKCLKQNYTQTKGLADYLYTRCNQDKICYLNAIVQYCLEYFRYVVDPSGEQWIKTPSRFFSDRTGDCKAYSIFIASLLQNAGIDCKLRFVDYNNNDYQHVYAVAVIDNIEIPLDVVALLQTKQNIGEEMPYKKKYDCNIYTHIVGCNSITI